MSGWRHVTCLQLDPENTTEDFLQDFTTLKNDVLELRIKRNSLEKTKQDRRQRIKAAGRELQDLRQRREAAVAQYEELSVILREVYELMREQDDEFNIDQRFMSGIETGCQRVEYSKKSLNSKRYSINQAYASMSRQHMLSPTVEADEEKESPVPMPTTHICPFSPKRLEVDAIIETGTLPADLSDSNQSDSDEESFELKRFSKGRKVSISFFEENPVDSSEANVAHRSNETEVKCIASESLFEMEPDLEAKLNESFYRQSRDQIDLSRHSLERTQESSYIEEGPVARPIQLKHFTPKEVENDYRQRMQARARSHQPVAHKCPGRKRACVQCNQKLKRGNEHVRCAQCGEHFCEECNRFGVSVFASILFTYLFLAYRKLQTSSVLGLKGG